MSILKTFSGRLSLLFLGVVALLGIGIYALVAPAFVSFLCETDQLVNMGLAPELAHDLEPRLRDGIDEAVVGDRLAHYSSVNPNVEIYLLDPNGAILKHYSQEDRPLVTQVLDTEPLQNLMAGGVPPIWGDDPFRPGQRRPFSVAPIAVGGEAGYYLYVVLGSDRYYTVAEAVRQSYIMQSALRGIGYVLLVSIGVGVLLFLMVTRRLRNMSHVVGRFAAGDLEPRIRDQKSDEIGQLAASFNQMADTISAHLHALEQNDSLRRELVANVSHDLRSPISSIQGYLETIQLRHDEMSPAERERHIEVVVRNIHRLNKLVSQLFELSKLEAQQVTPEFEEFSVAELINDLGMQFRPQAEALGVRLETVHDQHVALVRADIALVERAIANLIENALRHTPAGGCVRILAANELEAVRIEVCDTGQGIAEDDLPHVFDRFYRKDAGRGNGGGGLGLGLAIAKKIAELHGVTLAVNSQEDCGARFTFSLPRLALPAH